MKNLMHDLSLPFQAWLAKGHLKNNRVRASVIAGLSLFALIGGSTFNALTAPEPAAASTPDLVGTCNDPARLSCFINLPEPKTEETASSTPVGFQLASVSYIAPAEGSTFLLVSNPTDLGTDSSDVGNTGTPGTVAFTFTGDNNGGGNASGGNQVTGGTGGLLQLAAFNPPSFISPGGGSGGTPSIVPGNKPFTPAGSPPSDPPSVTPPENPPEILSPAVLLPTPPCVSGLCPPGTDPDPVIPPVVACASGNCPPSPNPDSIPDAIPNTPPSNPPGPPDPVITPVADNNPPKDPPINPSAVPEPAALALFGLGLLLIGLFRRKKH
jgi:PEP-CTERM motif